MNPTDLLAALHTAERLKDTTRHCCTSHRRPESVAEPVRVVQPDGRHAGDVGLSREIISMGMGGHLRLGQGVLGLASGFPWRIDVQVVPAGTELALRMGLPGVYRMMTKESADGPDVIQGDDFSWTPA